MFRPAAALKSSEILAGICGKFGLGRVWPPTNMSQRKSAKSNLQTNTVTEAAWAGPSARRFHLGHLNQGGSRTLDGKTTLPRHAATIH